MEEKTKIQNAAEELVREAEELQKDKRWEEALSVLKRALVIEPENPVIHFRIGNIYTIIGTLRKESAFFTLAESSLRSAVRLSQKDATEADSGSGQVRKQAYTALIGVSAQRGTLDELSAEFRNRLTEEPENDFFKKCLVQIAAISMVPIEDVTKAAPSSKKRGCLFKILLDYILLPGSVIGILLTQMVPPWKRLFPVFAFLFVIYVCAKLIQQHFRKV